MKRKAFTLTEILVVIAIMAIAALILFPMFARPREIDGHRPSCQSNLKQIGIGLSMYAQDHDEKFPPAKNAIGGWVDLVFPYIKSESVFQCPSDENRASKTSDYFTNARLSVVSLGKLAAPSMTIALGDGLPGQPFSANLSRLPAAWIDDAHSPAHRHLDTANYAFADGHVKAFKPIEITLDKPSANKPTSNKPNANKPTFLIR